MANARGIAIGVGAGLVVAALAYGVGRAQGSAGVDDAERRAATATATSSSAVAAVQGVLEGERNRSALLEARRRLHLAIVALDERNFGIAQEQLDGAHAILVSVERTDPSLQEFAKDLAALKLAASDDVGEQRVKVLALCKKLDARMPTTKK
ncbi:MAG: hypothetical protein NVS3B20_20800 [Polyangiales bacterium]